MKHRNSHTKSTRKTVALIASLIAVLMIAFTGSSAQAKSSSFRPVKVSKRSVAFRPHVPQRARIHRGKARFRAHGRTVTRRVPARRIKRAVRHHHLVRMAKPRSMRGPRARSIRVRNIRLHVGYTKPTSTQPTEPTDPTDPAGDGCTFGHFSAANLPGGCWKPYSDSSPFNRKLPADIPQTSNSSDVAARVGAFGKGAQIVTGVADTEADYDHPIYYSEPTDPKYTIHCTQPWGTCEGEGESINIPAQAKPAGGPDSHMAVIDQATNTEYDLYAVESKPANGGTIRVQWAGKTAIGTTDADGLGSAATAGDFGLAAGVIRPSELASGHIDHALAMAVKCTNDTSVAPAGDGVGRTCDSMGLPMKNAPAMGQHFYLNMTPAQIDALDEPQWRKTILTTMATYGMYVEDTGADYNGWALIVESGSSYTSFGQPDPWVQLGKKLGVDNWHSDGLNRQLYMFDMQKAVNWGSKLRVADPCVGLGTC